MLRSVLVTSVLVVAACGGSPRSEPHGPAVAKAPPAKTAPPPKLGSGTPAADPTAPEIGCLQPTCAFHAGAAAYFTCLAGGAGACFHFGAACAPADGCMFDPRDRTYKQCAKPVEGACTQWAAACTPRSGCMFDPDDGLHHHCEDAGGGACRKYGALCAP